MEALSLGREPVWGDDAILDEELELQPLCAWCLKRRTEPDESLCSECLEIVRKTPCSWGSEDEKKKGKGRA